jgi:hypothetical protein
MLPCCIGRIIFCASGGALDPAPATVPDPWLVGFDVLHTHLQQIVSILLEKWLATTMDPADRVILQVNGQFTLHRVLTFLGFFLRYIA